MGSLGPMETVRVSDLVVYPIKSCQGISLKSVNLTVTGMAYDRQWVIVAADKRRLFTQRVTPTLAHVTPSLPPEALQGRPLLPNAVMEVNAPGMGTLRVSLIPPKRPSGLQKLLGGSGPGVRGAPYEVTVWGWSGEGLDEGPEAASWWSEYLGMPSRMLCFDTEKVKRQVLKAKEGHSFLFGDDAQYLVASKASLDEVNKHLETAIPMNRFRPNIITDGCSAFAEDTWSVLDIRHDNSTKGLQLNYVKPCARCKIPTIDQETLQCQGAVTEALREFRTGAALGWDVSLAKEVFFGTYFVLDSTDTGLLPADVEPVISVGDIVHVTHRHAGPAAS